MDYFHLKAIRMAQTAGVRNTAFKRKGFALFHSRVLKLRSSGWAVVGEDRAVARFVWVKAITINEPTMFISRHFILQTQSCLVFIVHDLNPCYWAKLWRSSCLFNYINKLTIIFILEQISSFDKVSINIKTAFNSLIKLFLAFLVTHCLFWM